MKQSHFLGIDLGTSSCRALLIDERGNERGRGSSEYAIQTPQPGWAEQDPQQWWEAAVIAVQSALMQADLHVPAMIESISLSGQMHGTVVLDSSGHVLRPAILWADSRSGAEAAQIDESVGSGRHYAITGNPCAAGFQGSSLLWLRKNEPEIFSRARHVLLPKDWLRYRLMGSMASEPTDACGTALFDIREKCWSEEILKVIDINKDCLPPLIRPFDVSGPLRLDAAGALGLCAGIPVIAGGGDQAMAALGMGLCEPGDAAVAISTGGQFLAVIGTLPENLLRGLHTLVHALDNRWILMGAILSAGLSLRWLRDQVFCLPHEINNRPAYEIMAFEAAQVPPGSDGLLFIPYLAGERTPHLDPEARGGFHGLTTRHTRAHLVRAVLEGVAFAFRDALELMRQGGADIHSAIASGGGSRSPLWRQILADILNLEILLIDREEHSVFGAALAAAFGTGALNLQSWKERRHEVIARTVPNPENRQLYDTLFDRYGSIYPIMKSLH